MTAEEKKKRDREKRRDLIIKIILIIIIILLLIHNCVMMGKKDDGNGKGNDIDIDCKDGKCDPKPGGNDLPVDCLNDPNNQKCIIPNFVGKSKEDVLEWLRQIENEINIQYVITNSQESDGTVLDQSETGVSIKDLIENNRPLTITLSNKDTIVDCLNESNASYCVVPNFIGKTKEDVLDWLATISNDIKVRYITNDSNKNNGTVLDQSTREGTKIKDIINSNGEIVITLANENPEIDCLKYSYNMDCRIPNFKDKTKEDVEAWLKTIKTDIKVKYVDKNSGIGTGTILGQSVQSGITIKEMLESTDTIVIEVSRKENTSPNTKPNNNNNNENNNNDNVNPGDNNENPPEEEEETEGLIVKDSEIEWSEETELNIFSNSNNSKEGTIAPESSDTYEFKINNNTNYNLKYKITFTENNTYNINMKYKLKKNGTYITNDYVSYNELNFDNLLLNKDEKDEYSLEWKWVSSDNDTEIGMQARTIDVLYNLKIKIEAESV